MAILVSFRASLLSLSCVDDDSALLSPFRFEPLFILSLFPSAFYPSLFSLSFCLTFFSATRFGRLWRARKLKPR